MNWVSVDEVKNYADLMELSISRWEGDGTYPLLKNIIEASENFFQSQLKRNLVYEENFEKYYDGTGKKILILDEYPIIQLKQISFTGDVETIIDVEEITVDEERGILIYENGFPKGKRNIFVKMEKGWTSETIPKDLKQAMIYEILIQIISLSPDEVERQGLTSIRIGDVSKTFGGIYSNQLTFFQNEKEKMIKTYRSLLVS